MRTGEQGRAAIARTIVAGVAVAGVCLAVGILGDVRYGSGSDVGGKLATARVMAERRTCDPDIGWWAAPWDPEGDLHQILNTLPVGESYIQATSPAYQCVLRPLQHTLGPWGPVLLSIAGVVAAGLASMRLAALLGGDDAAAWTSLVLVGVVGPTAFYGTDAWEHAPAVGLLLWVVVLVLRGPSRGRAAVAGVLLGAASVLRAEAAIYGAALAVGVLLTPALRRRWLAAPGRLALGALAAGTVVGANLVFERAVVGASVRASRGERLVESSAPAGGGTEELVERVRTAIATAGGVLASDSAPALVLAVAALVALLGAGWRLVHRPRSERLPVLEAVAAALVLVRVLAGLGFMPGALTAAPVAGAGAAGAGKGAAHRVLVLTALVAMPLIWMLQWPGNLLAQWGGRYLLLSASLLTIVGAALLVTDGGWRRPGVAILLVTAVVVGAAGLGFRVERTDEVARVVDRIQQVPRDSVIVSGNAVLAREAGSSYGEVRWLALDAAPEIELASRILAEVRPSNVTVVALDPGRLRLTGYREVGVERVPYFGETLEIHRLERQG